MSQSRKSRIAYSAGGVCYRWMDDVPEVVLIATHNSTRWGLPKGHREGRETFAQAARREINEETGLRGEIVCSLSAIQYWFRVESHFVHKWVEFFLFRCTGGYLKPQLSEIDDAKWFLLPDALEQISFPRERSVLEVVNTIWRSNRLV
ncbi:MULTISPECIES: NUDIX hydrolase [Herpetosiphon]|uniref:NUDIX hydrolase n=1 Tax=Herpetosiphon TaxID=64 RepID=UPI000D7C7F5C|nr:MULTISPECIES: NUDIX hydrolase [Herpetosiphon]MBM7844907.1 8-oxo-dGTP pyrophosphatase MutT (NUDIX family) [Herpetosiphon giganteus]